MSQRKMFEIKCTDCGKTATVPFKPTKGKPAYCRTCFSKHKSRIGMDFKFARPKAWVRR
jgi:CxxC-x17-CxxC domain-containing protein